MNWWCLCEPAAPNVGSCTRFCNTPWSKWQFLACTHESVSTNTQTLVTFDLNLKPEAAWGKVMSWIGTGRQTDWLILDIGCYWWHTKSFVCVCLICRLQNRSIHKHPQFFSSCFYSLIWFQKWLMFQLLLFYILLMPLYPHPPFSLTGCTNDSNGSTFCLKLSLHSFWATLFMGIH